MGNKSVSNAASLLFALCCIAQSPFVPAQRLQERIETEKGETREALVAHPLSWWTDNPLRLDSTHDLMLGFKAPDGRPITAKDYEIHQTATHLGVVAGHSIVQILTDIRPGKRVIAAGYAVDDGSAAEWKDLLVSDTHNRFLDIYALHFDEGGLVQKANAEIYGDGSDAVLGTCDPATGNGGGCIEGYWWFDNEGVHELNFSPVIDAISRAIPPSSTFVPSCWALNLKMMELNSPVLQGDPGCRSCEQIGEVRATFRIHQGIAQPVSIRFEPSKP